MVPVTIRIRMGVTNWTTPDALARRLRQPTLGKYRERESPCEFCLTNQLPGRGLGTRHLWSKVVCRNFMSTTPWVNTCMPLMSKLNGLISNKRQFVKLRDPEQS